MSTNDIHCGVFPIPFSKLVSIIFFMKFQAYLYTNPLGEIAAKSGVVINRIHFSPTDHIIAFSGMVSGGQGRLGKEPHFTAPVYVYKNKVNSSNHMRRRSLTLPAMPLLTTKVG